MLLFASSRCGHQASLGPEMKSTGEVMGVGTTFGEAFVKSQLEAGIAPAALGQVASDREERGQAARCIHRPRPGAAMGFELATEGTAAAIAEAVRVCAGGQQGHRGLVAHRDMIKNDEIAMVINTVEERCNVDFADCAPSAPARWLRA